MLLQVTVESQTIQDQLAQLNFDTEGLEESCQEMADNMEMPQCEEGEMMEGGDMEEGDMEEGEMEEPMAAGRQAKKNKKKSKKSKKSKKNKKNKSKGKNQQDEPSMPEMQMPELTPEEQAQMDAAIESAVRNLAHIGCIMKNVEMGCKQAVVDKMMMMEEMTTGRR